MGLFDPYLILYCQNDEVSPDVHPRVTRGRRSDTPTVDGSKLPLVDRSSSELSAVFSTNHVLARLHLIMTETVF